MIHGEHSVMDPSVMVERFNQMHLQNANLFIIKKLDSAYSKIERPTPLIRSVIHSFIYLTEGEALISIGEDSYLFKSGECAVIPAGQVFSVRYYDNCVGYMGGFHIDFMCVDMEGHNVLRRFDFLRRWGNHKVYFRPEVCSFISSIFDRLYSENQTGHNKEIIRAYLSTLLVEIGAAYHADDSVNSADEMSYNNCICNKFVELAFDKPDRRLNVAYYAEKLNITSGHLSRIVKKFTGKTPLTWLDEALVLEAKVELGHTDLSVSEIASNIGILDPSYFARLFKKYVGVSPTEFRSMSQEK